MSTPPSTERRRTTARELTGGRRPRRKDSEPDLARPDSSGCLSGSGSSSFTSLPGRLYGIATRSAPGTLAAEARTGSARPIRRPSRRTNTVTTTGRAVPIDRDAGDWTRLRCGAPATVEPSRRAAAVALLAAAGRRPAAARHRHRGRLNAWIVRYRCRPVLQFRARALQERPPDRYVSAATDAVRGEFRMRDLSGAVRVSSLEFRTQGRRGRTALRRATRRARNDSERSSRICRHLRPRASRSGADRRRRTRVR